MRGARAWRKGLHTCTLSSSRASRSRYDQGKRVTDEGGRDDELETTRVRDDEEEGTTNRNEATNEATRVAETTT